MNMLAQMSWGQWFLTVTIIGVCCLLMLVVLLQRGRGQGLTGAFGGGGGGGAFGAKTGDVFTVITVVMAAVFLLLSVIANFALDESGEKSPTTALAPAPVDPGQSPPQDGQTPTTGPPATGQTSPDSGAADTGSSPAASESSTTDDLLLVPSIDELKQEKPAPSGKAPQSKDRGSKPPDDSTADEPADGGSAGPDEKGDPGKGDDTSPEESADGSGV